MPVSYQWVRFAPRFAVKLCLMPRPKSAPAISPPIFWRRPSLTVLYPRPSSRVAERSIDRFHPGSGTAMRR